MQAASFLDWLRDMLLWAPRKVFEMLLTGLATVVNAIPVPSFIENAGSYFSALPSGVVYFTQAFQLPLGIGMMVSAYVLRFLIRRIPVIG